MVVVVIEVVEVAIEEAAEEVFTLESVLNFTI